ncbi:MAG: hypothetical protein PHR56_06620 [Dehalococcoidales bacterium]|nr:hypothetical protein [Dehalococcoidales bacterium]
MNYRELKSDEFVRHLLKDISNNADWLQLFLMFSRFEYALKRSGYIKTSDDTRAEGLTCDGISCYRGYVTADWRKFGTAIKASFAENRNPILLDAINLLFEYPPYKQVLNTHKELDWREPEYKKRDLQSLIQIVKTVRNNLFHGGKYPTMPVQDPSRDVELVRNCIVVLKYFIYSSRNVQRHYFEILN